MLDGLFGIQRLFVNGVELVTRKSPNFTVATNQVAYADDPGTGTTELQLGFTVAAAAPTTGAHVRGEIVFHSAPSAAGFIGWVCTASGTPGTWKTFGAITP